MALKLKLTFESPKYFEYCKLVTINVDGITDPHEFAIEVARLEPHLSGPQPVILSGRAPVWGFAMLVHAAHATPAVMIYDPRLGYVVVQSHSPRFKTGEIINGLEDLKTATIV